MRSYSMGGRRISDSDAIRKVIDAQAKIDELKQENKALRKDRNDLLGEHKDFRVRRRIKKMPPSKPKSAGDYVRLSFGDMHGLLMEKPAVDALLADIKKIDPDEVVIGGDMLECGGFLAKHQPIGFVATSEYSYQDDVEAANWFLDRLAEAAPRAFVVFIEGNHEDRLERHVVDEMRAKGRDAQFMLDLMGPQTVLRIKERNIKYVRRQDIVDDLPPGWIKRGKMFFTHELAGGVNGASKAINKTAGNVTFFHTHQESAATKVYPGIGIVKAFCPGCLCQRRPLWRHSNPTNWSHGYGIDVVSKSGLFQHISVPIWNGESLGASLLNRK